MITREFLLAEVKRALGDRSNAVEIVTELERRLPVDGRNTDRMYLTGSYAVMWWKSQDGEWTHTHDMRNGHIINTIKWLMARDMPVAHGFTGAMLHDADLMMEQKRLELVREAQWRGLTDLTIPELVPANICAQCGQVKVNGSCPLHPHARNVKVMVDGTDVSPYLTSVSIPVPKKEPPFPGATPIVCTICGGHHDEITHE